jgi:hypothetical protein
MQYPLRKAISYRTVVHAENETQTLRSPDDGSARVEWNLQLRGLSDTELASIQSFYRSLRGAHGEFTFLDPDGNLLSNSEDLDGSPWSRSPHLSVAPAATSPLVASTAWSTHSSAAGVGELWQSVALPAHYHWLFSIYARAQTPVSLTLFLRSAHGIQQHTVPLTAQWTRYWFGGMWWPSGEQFDVGLRIPSGMTVELGAAQLETQSSPAAYKRTTSPTGVYEGSRFLDDALRVTSLAPNCHQLNLRIGAPFVG